MNLGGGGVDFLTRWMTVSFSRRTLFHGVRLYTRTCRLCVGLRFDVETDKARRCKIYWYHCESEASICDCHLRVTVKKDRKEAELPKHRNGVCRLHKFHPSFHLQLERDAIWDCHLALLAGGNGTFTHDVTSWRTWQRERIFCSLWRSHRAKCVIEREIHLQEQHSSSLCWSNCVCARRKAFQNIAFITTWFISPVSLI
jgi:hypothetical protein